MRKPDGLMPLFYDGLLADVIEAIGSGRSEAALAVGVARLRTYHAIGMAIVSRESDEGWGAQVIPRLSTDLKIRYPQQRGFSVRSLTYMRNFAVAWPDLNFATAVAKLPWGHVTDLLDRLPDAQTRDWYASRAVSGGWSRSFLQHQIRSQLHLRIGAAPSNFDAVLEPQDAEMAQQMLRDPVTLDFLGIDQEARERDLEQALVDNITRTLLELGDGLAFVGQQVLIVVDDREFLIDLLFFSIPQARYIVVELKTGEFDPRDTGQLNFYVNVIDDQRRLPGHGSTIGLLLCAGHGSAVVRYSLAGVATPMAVAAFTRDVLPADVRAALPSEADLQRAIEEGGNGHG